MSISVRYIVAAACCVAVLFAASLFLGSVPIPLRAVLGILTGGEAGQASWSFIVLESRLPQAVTALLAGAALATSGLMLHYFQIRLRHLLANFPFWRILIWK